MLKFILFLSAPVRLTNPSVPRVQTIPEDLESTHQSYLGIYVHGVKSGCLLTGGLILGSERVLLQKKGDFTHFKRLLERGCLMVVIKSEGCVEKKRNDKFTQETKCKDYFKASKQNPFLLHQSFSVQ